MANFCNFLSPNVHDRIQTLDIRMISRGFSHCATKPQCLYHLFCSFLMSWIFIFMLYGHILLFSLSRCLWHDSNPRSRDDKLRVWPVCHQAKMFVSLILFFFNVMNYYICVIWSYFAIFLSWCLWQDSQPSISGWYVGGLTTVLPGHNVYITLVLIFFVKLLEWLITFKLPDQFLPQNKEKVFLLIYSA